MIILSITLCYAACANASINDPFNTDALTTSNPQTYWRGTTDLTLNDIAIQKAVSLLPHKPLTLSEITDFALRNNPTTRLAWAQAKFAAASLGNAKSAYLPQITAGLSAQYSSNLFSNNQGSGNTTGPNFSLSYLLLDFGTRANTVRAQHYALIAANLNQNSAIQQLIFQIEQAYYQVLGQQALIVANQQSVAEANTSVKASQALRSQGLATVGDVYQAQSSLAQATLSLEQATGNYQIALGQLATAMGVPANTPLQLTPLTEVLPIHKVSDNMQTLMAKATHNRPDLLAAAAQVRQSESQLTATKAAALPVVSLNASAGPVTIDNVGTTNTSISLNLTVPLFTGYSQTYQVRQAKAQVLASEADRDTLYQQVKLQVWQAYYALQTAGANVSSSEVFLKSSLQASKQARGQYQAGVGNILSVLSTQSSLATARVQSIQARLNWYIALAQLAQAMGQLSS
ncbi:MAG TPA: TolC family protein [Gammaproteobacteria bacterium]|nr:TolC family protein [Gammaproteobacteria bacterium]